LHVSLVVGVVQGFGELGEQGFETHTKLQGRLAGAAGV
jgi:hypothetical protein